MNSIRNPKTNRAISLTLLTNSGNYRFNPTIFKLIKEGYTHLLDKTDYIYDKETNQIYLRRNVFYQTGPMKGHVKGKFEDTKVENGILVKNKDFNKEKSNMSKGFKGMLYTDVINISEIKFPTIVFDEKKEEIMGIVESRLEQLKSIKLILGVRIEYYKFAADDNGDSVEKNRIFSFYTNKATSILNPSGIDSVVMHQIHELLHMIEEVLQDSSWIYKRTLAIYINTSRFKISKKGSSYIPLPHEIHVKKACINIKNEDKRCFGYSVLAGIKNLDSKKYKLQYAGTYDKYFDELNMDGIDYPVLVDNNVYEKFENQNDIAINVLKLGKDNRVTTLYISRLGKKLSSCINIMLIGSDEHWHYVLVKNISRLIGADISKMHTQKHTCLNCGQNYTTEINLEDHWVQCQKQEPTKIEMPEPGSQVFFEGKFNLLTMKKPFIIYADFESTLRKNGQEVSDKMTIIHDQVPNSYCMYLISSYSSFKPITKFYRGVEEHDVMDHFYSDLTELDNVVRDCLKINKPMELTREEAKIHYGKKSCYICHETPEYLVRDHDHFTGEYLGAACNRCNINRNFKGYKLPVVFHNLRGYDSHHIIKYFKNRNADISCIPSTSEKFMSFTIDKLVFIDSYQFTLASLDTLVEGLNNNENKLVHTVQFLKDSGYYKFKDILLRKGSYPYEFVADSEVFNHKGLPDAEYFHDKKSYSNAIEVYENLNFKNFGQYHDLYLKMDVYLLADVFEEFRKNTIENYSIDPCHRFTSPGVSWLAMLKMTNVKLDLITDYDMYMKFERGIRGGISMISNRYSKANNKYMHDFDDMKECTYISYLDANNLYGWAMEQSLPVGDYINESIDGWTKERILQLEDNGERGYVFEVNLEYPKEIHDLHQDYPLAPDRIKMKRDDYSNYMRSITKNNDRTEKLLCTLGDKRDYMVHYRNLKLYLELGMKLESIKSVISFKQSKFLAQYIQENTARRAATTLEYLQDFFKLMNNSVFGKTMEDVRKHRSVDLLTDEAKIQKRLNSNYYKSSMQINDELLAIEKFKKVVKLDKPIAVGFSILELSKVHMYSFYYRYMKPKYGNNVKLLMTDTDSLVMEIKTDDFYSDMKADGFHYDLSNFKNRFYDGINKKVVGKFKDETAGQPIREFIGIRSKVYSFIVEKDSEEHKKLKGISKSVVKNEITHKNYNDCVFFNIPKRVDMEVIQSQNHSIKTLKINKSALSCFDNKRYYLDQINSLPYGHYRTK